jgi:U3-containing 90S pre-ribosomal complex subunit CMS1-like protein
VFLKNPCRRGRRLTASAAIQFAKHIKLDEAVAFLKSKRTGIAVGTPARLMDLLDNGIPASSPGTFPPRPPLTFLCRGALRRRPATSRCRCLPHRSKATRCAGDEGDDDAAGQTPYEKRVKGAVHSRGETARPDVLLIESSSGLMGSTMGFAAAASIRRRVDMETNSLPG